MFNLKRSPYCAEYEIATLDGDLVTMHPRRSIYELDQKRLNQIAPVSTFVAAIALYNNHDANLHDHRRWLENMLGFDLVMKKRQSERYSKLHDAILMPCPGPRVRSLEMMRLMLGR